MPIRDRATSRDAAFDLVVGRSHDLGTEAAQNNDRFRPMPFVHRHGRLRPPFRDFRERPRLIPERANAIG